MPLDAPEGGRMFHTPLDVTTRWSSHRFRALPYSMLPMNSSDVTSFFAMVMLGSPVWMLRFDVSIASSYSMFFVSPMAVKNSFLMTLRSATMLALPFGLF